MIITWISSKVAKVRRLSNNNLLHNLSFRNMVSISIITHRSSKGGRRDVCDSNTISHHNYRAPILKPKRPTRLESPRSFTVSSGTTSSQTTPAPPTTPRSGPGGVICSTQEIRFIFVVSAFVCRAEGFFPHPSSCKKYYWCLDTPSQGMVAHTFSCPQGLFFNEITDGCDFLRNVNCGDKDTEEKEETKETSEKIETEEEVLSEADNEEEDVEDPKSLKDILEIVKAAGNTYFLNLN